MLAEWNSLPEHLQITLSQAAISRAALTIANQAETLAEEIESGCIVDLGGPDALRLFATLVRITGNDPLAPQGSA